MRLPAVCLFVVPMWMAAGSRPAATPETDRIQTREDGVSIDQIVIGSAKHLTTPPGAATNDTTIVSRP